MAKRKTKKAKKPIILSNPSPEPADLKQIDQGLIKSKNEISKICRLCESRDGPFLNIFDSEAVTTKIDAVLPVVIAENDELPHKICFRCSAKLEELYEFIQRCVKTQENLNVSFGKKSTKITKSVTQKSLWEENLNKSKISHDDICDAVIKRAMEGIKNIPSEAFKPGSNDTVNYCNSPSMTSRTTGKPSKVNDDLVKSKIVASDIAKMVMAPEKITAPLTRSSRSNHALLGGLQDPTKAKKNKPTSNGNKEGIPLRDDCSTVDSVTETAARQLLCLTEMYPTKSAIKKTKIVLKSVQKPKNKNLPKETNKSSQAQVLNTKQNLPTEEKKTEKMEQTTETVAKPFNVMDYVDVLKVSDVGVLYQCNLCDRNFLKKDIVLSHGCAKNNVPKKNFVTKVMPVEQPKLSVPSVMYINTKKDGMPKKALSSENKSDRDTQIAKPMTEEIHNATVASPSPVRKTKPRIGPASKVRREPDTTTVTEKSNSALQGVSIPGLDSRYKLVPGPNNTLSLVEATPDSPVAANQALAAEQTHIKTGRKSRRLSIMVPGPNHTLSLVEATPDSPVAANQALAAEQTHIKTVRKRRQSTYNQVHSNESNHEGQKVSGNSKIRKLSPEIIDLDDPASSPTQTLPYPVGLFKTPHSSSSPYEPQFTGFCISDAKKQSYTIVPTGNPSKLLISAKPQPQIPVEDSFKKGQKKKKSNITVTEESKRRTSTLEGMEFREDPGNFTIINLDPVLQPGYVLPTDNISQSVSTSTITRNKREKNILDNKIGQYSCNMCGQVFSQESILLEHIRLHYNKIDQGDQLTSEKKIHKRGRKS